MVARRWNAKSLFCSRKKQCKNGPVPKTPPRLECQLWFRRFSLSTLRSPVKFPPAAGDAHYIYFYHNSPVNISFRVAHQSCGPLCRYFLEG